MSEIILKIENLSKQYRLGLVGTGTIQDDLKRWWHKIRGKEDPFLKVGDVNDRSTKATSDYVWALKDINFEVREGEVLGVIGKNGAGKSTLLKILSKITSPTTGSVKSKGRVASLLEVGTGFHGEMTGRENIYLNGAILGMTKSEISNKIEEIIEFSGCERYIDTPVKRYSSGMTVRLAFAVAAFLEPDILIIDEVLAVGDAEFQKKAIGKMQDISKGEGRTVLFVSHNMAAVKSLCTRSLVLENGSVVFEGETDESINFYLNRNERTGNSKKWKYKEAPGNDKVKVLNFSVLDESGSSNIFIDSIICIRYTLYVKIKNSTLGTTIRILNQEEIIVLSDGVLIAPDMNSREEVYEIEASIPSKFLNSGLYSIDLIVGENKKYVIYSNKSIVNFEVSFGKKIKHNIRQKGICYSELNWNVNILDND